METRLTELEIRYSHLERLFEDLNGVVIEQQKTIDALLKQSAALRERLLGLEEPIKDERPPHY